VLDSLDIEGKKEWNDGWRNEWDFPYAYAEIHCQANMHVRKKIQTYRCELIGETREERGGGQEVGFFPFESVVTASRMQSFRPVSGLTDTPWCEGLYSTTN
jgi:hypothetical protein